MRAFAVVCCHCSAANYVVFFFFFRATFKVMDIDHVPICVSAAVFNATLTERLQTREVWNIYLSSNTSILIIYR